ncbi:hypothetical protein ACF08B_36250 [Streptomyces sp. NPDC015139]|uniref:hypothetical protein n=1 Tax=Streptomyces sp. NPDC015139 TaxID=3364942 RepID=UPI003701C356
MPYLAAVLFAVALVVIVASLAAAAAAKLARMERASYPAAVKRAALTFAGTLTLAATLTGALAALRR